jgi:deoxyhypusine synthase
MKRYQNVVVRKRGSWLIESVRSKLFLGFTSNLVSSGVRDTIRYLVKHHMVSHFMV